jgi:ATP-dependent Clp protease ATP-binding subunit ClpB
MSEYMEKHAVSRLVGAPPGYVGYDEGGQLTEAVRRRPYSVVLLDELEKAHSDVFNILLQVLDDGRLTDGQGRTVDFRNTVVIMTSNLGAQHIAGTDASAGDTAVQQAAMQQVLRGHFRPEFLNRIDDVVVFAALGRAQVAAILENQLKDLRALLAGRQLSLEITQRAVAHLAQAGYDPAYGARPLKRTLQREVQNPLAMALLGGDYVAGDTVVVDLAEDATALSFRKGPKVVAAVA